MRTRIVQLLAVAAISCSRPDASATGGTTATAAASAPATAPAVHVLLDGAEVATVAVEELIGRRPLAELLPEAARDASRWRELTAESRDGKHRLRLRRFGDDHRDEHAMLFADTKAGPSLGLFRTASRRVHHLDKPLKLLTGVHRIEIRTKEVANEGKPDPVVLHVGGSDRTIAEDELARLPLVAPPVPKEGRRAGWKLSDLLQLAAPGARVTRVVAEDEHGETLAIEGPFDDPKRMMIVRRTQRGALDFSVWETGGKAPAQRMRGMTRIRLELVLQK